MEEMELGPNGALMFCMEYLLENQNWLIEQLQELVAEDSYVLFDCPGQIELFNDRDIFRELIKIIQNYGILCCLCRFFVGFDVHDGRQFHFLVE